jgi:hypothetical protein
LHILNDWLLIDDNDTINLILNYRSIEEVKKHFILRQNRSYLHYEPECTFCQDGHPLRLRFVSQVLIEGINLRWEFGAEVKRQLLKLEPFVDASGFIRLQVSRLGTGKKTLYHCVYMQDFNTSTNSSRYTSGKYGHMVQR